MKKFVSAALAASLLATPLIATPASAAPRHDDRGRYDQRYDHGRNDQRYDRGRYDQRSSYRNNDRYSYGAHQVRRWNRGDRFDSRYARSYRYIGNPRAYRLYDAPRGYRWVQSDNDAILVAIASGLIGAVVANAF